MYKPLFLLIFSLAVTASALRAQSIEGAETEPSVTEKRDRVFSINHPNDIKEIGRPVVYKNGILFTYSGSSNDRVDLTGSFPALQWTKKVRMIRNDYGLFFAFLPLDLKQGEYGYRFCVNDIWLNDPNQTHYIDDGYGTRMSALILGRELLILPASPRRLKDGRMQFFLEDRGYTNVSFIGSANNWDPYTDYMQLEAGYWLITRRVKKGQTFYKYHVDGRAILDPLNPNVASIRFGEKANFVPIE